MNHRGLEHWKINSIWDAGEHSIKFELKLLLVTSQKAHTLDIIELNSQVEFNNFSRQIELGGKVKVTVRICKLHFRISQQLFSSFFETY